MISEARVRPVPSGVRWEEAREPFPLPDLRPGEAAAMRDVVAQRRREFAAGRWCARRALAQLGHPPGPILRGPRGEPLWPPGVVGSVTHCPGYAAAAVADRRQVLALGIDAEPDLPLPHGVIDLIALPEELNQLRPATRQRPEVSFDRLLFSAKESLYKALYPHTGAWLDFRQARLDVDATAGRFTVLEVDAPACVELELRRVQGRWERDDGLLLTAVVLPT